MRRVGTGCLEFRPYGANIPGLAGVVPSTAALRPDARRGIKALQTRALALKEVGEKPYAVCVRRRLSFYLPIHCFQSAYVSKILVSDSGYAHAN